MVISQNCWSDDRTNPSKQLRIEKKKCVEKNQDITLSWTNEIKLMKTIKLLERTNIF